MAEPAAGVGAGGAAGVLGAGMLDDRPDVVAFGLAVERRGNDDDEAHKEDEAEHDSEALLGAPLWHVEAEVGKRHPLS